MYVFDTPNHAFIDDIGLYVHLHIYIYIYIYVCVYVCMYVGI